MAFKDNTLEFHDTKIIDTVLNMEVMMSWESSIMEKSAEYICSNKGDILEIGFGMGICSDYIQAQGINSHTIIEIHPQIIERLNTWATGKSNVTVIEGDWSTITLNSTYDGIFLDTFGDLNLNNFKAFAVAKSKNGAKITYWNNEQKENNPYNFNSVSYDIISVAPDANTYTEISSNYYMPKVSL